MAGSIPRIHVTPCLPLISSLVLQQTDEACGGASESVRSTSIYVSRRSSLDGTRSSDCQDPLFLNHSAPAEFRFDNQLTEICVVSCATEGISVILNRFGLDPLDPSLPEDSEHQERIDNCIVQPDCIVEIDCQDCRSSGLFDPDHFYPLH